MNPEQERAWWAAARACFRPGAFWDNHLEGYNGPPPNRGPRRWDLVRRVAEMILSPPVRKVWP